MSKYMGNTFPVSLSNEGLDRDEGIVFYEIFPEADDSSWYLVIEGRTAAFDIVNVLPRLDRCERTGSSRQA